MMHPDTELRFIDRDVGHGVLATRFIPKGTITWARDAMDQTWSREAARRLPDVLRKALESLGYVDRVGNYVLPWDHSRFENHSCEPTSLMTAYDVEIAIRDIQPGEEVTNDYSALALFHEHPFVCRCGKPTCRGRLGPEDLARLAPGMDARVRVLLPEIPRVEQPLWGLIADPTGLLRAIEKPEEMLSCATDFSAASG